MNPRIILLFAAAVFVAVVAAFLARSYLQSNQPGQTQVAGQQETTKILVAANNLPMGHIIEVGDLTWQDWPLDGLNANYLQEEDYNLEDMAGSVVRYGVTAGEPMTSVRLISPGERGFLAAVLTPGMRAISIPVTRTSGVAGFVFPGDRVDLILTHTLEVDTLESLIAASTGAGTVKEKEEHEASVTVLRNVRVLAVDTRTDDMDKTPELGKSVTLEVTPEIAERVALITRLGVVALSLRSITAADGTKNAAMSPDDDGPFSSPQTHTWDYQASHLIKPVLTSVDIQTIVLSRGSETQILILSTTGNLETRDKDARR